MSTAKTTKHADRRAVIVNNERNERGPLLLLFVRESVARQSSRIIAFENPSFCFLLLFVFAGRLEGESDEKGSVG